MSDFKPLVMRRLKHVVDTDAKFQSWIVSNTRVCQEMCLFYVFDQSVETMWGTGLLFDADFMKTPAQLNKVLSGAFKACYPDPPHTVMHAFVEDVIHAMANGNKQGDRSGDEFTAVGGLANCTSDGFEGRGKPWVDNFVIEFDAALKEVTSADHDAKAYFAGVAKDCQHECAPNTLRLAVETLWNSGQIDDQEHRGLWERDGVTGALKGCYAGAPDSVIGTLVDRLMTKLPSPQLGATSEEDFVDRFEGLVANSIVEVENSNAKLNDWLTLKTLDCQRTCLRDMFGESVKTMWRTGQLFDEEHKRGLLKTAFEGGFKACYPTSRPNEVSLVVRRITGVLSFEKHVARRLEGEELAAAPRRLAMCPGGSSIGAWRDWIEKFAGDVPKRLDEAVLKFSWGTRKEQTACAQKTLRSVMENLWNTAIIEDDKIHNVAGEAVAGALEACYMDAPAADLTTAAGQVLSDMPTQDAVRLVTERAEKMAKLAEKKNLEPQVEPKEPAPQCMNPTQIQHGRDRAKFIDVFNPVVLRTLIKVTDMPSHAAIKKWLRHDTWDCQKPCLRYVFDRSVETMWGTGQLFGDDNKTLLTQALTGAFKACYPRSFRPHVLALISQVVDVVSARPRLRRPEEKPLEASHRFARCPDTSSAGVAWVDKFMKQFFEVLNGESNKSKKNDYFAETAKTCQHECAPMAMRKALETFWGTGLCADPHDSKQADQSDARYIGVIRMGQTSPRDLFDDFEAASSRFPELGHGYKDDSHLIKRLASTKKLVITPTSTYDWFCEQLRNEEGFREIPRNHSRTLLESMVAKARLQALVTGALKACYAGAPHDGVYAMVGELMTRMGAGAWLQDPSSFAKLYGAEDSEGPPFTAGRDLRFLALAAVASVAGLLSAVASARVLFARRGRKVAIAHEHEVLMQSENGAELE